MQNVDFTRRKQRKYNCYAVYCMIIPAVFLLSAGCLETVSESGGAGKTKPIEMTGSAERGAPGTGVRKDRLKGGAVKHKVRPGESLSILAERYYGTIKDYDTVGAVARANRIQPHRIRAGQEIVFPVIKTPDGLVYYPERVSSYRLSDETAEGATETPGDGNKTPSNEVEARYRAGMAFFEQRQWDKAVTEFEQVLKADIHYKDAVRYFEAAARNAETAAKVETRKETAFGLLEAERYSAAVSAFSKILADTPEDREAREGLFQSHYRRGLKRFQEKRYISAKESFEAALSLNPECGKCKGYIRDSEETFMREHYDTAMQRLNDPNLTEKTLKRAIDELRAVIEIDPDYREAEKNLEKALKRLQVIRRLKKKGS